MAANKNILFLCTGNYYRSRFAEILFNSIAEKMSLPWAATSKALALERGLNNIGPMAPSAIEAVKALGIRAAHAVTRFPAAVISEDFERAHRVIALKRDEHLPLMQERHPDWSEKIEYWHVEDDPQALTVIEGEMMRFVSRLLGGGNRPEPVASAKPEPPRKVLTAKVGRETAGRRGKGVTTVFDLPLGEETLRELAATLKQRCGTGGTVKDGRIEIQGDQRKRIIAELEKLGYKVKRAGG